MRDYTAIPHEYYGEMADLSDEEWGRLTRALLHYSITGEETELPGNERFFWRRVINREQRYQTNFDAHTEKLREAGKRGAAKRWGTGTNGQAMPPYSQNGNTESNSDTESNPYNKTVPRSTARRNQAASAARDERLKRDMEALEGIMKAGGDL